MVSEFSSAIYQVGKRHFANVTLMSPKILKYLNKNDVSNKIQQLNKEDIRYLVRSLSTDSKMHEALGEWSNKEAIKLINLTTLDSPESKKEHSS